MTFIKNICGKVLILVLFIPLLLSCSAEINKASSYQWSPEELVLEEKLRKRELSQEEYYKGIPKVKRDQVICFALYTVHKNVLKLTAQLYPLNKEEDRFCRLEIKKNMQWVEIAKADVIERGFTAPFRVENWDDTQTVKYRVAHGKKAYFAGTIRKNPIDKNEIVVAGFTGNSVQSGHGGDISRKDLVDNVKKIDADILFFSGDQVYNHKRHLMVWLKFGRDFREIIKDRPTVCLPDDHDVGQPNLWGNSGSVANLGGATDGGYTMPIAYVKEVERAQTSHLPDAYFKGVLKRGLTTYYGDWNWGRISFAILEDRKFKTGPSYLIPKQGPRPDHIRNPAYDPKSVDVPQAILLGKTQLQFIDNWAQNWTNSDFKVALSQTIFCGGAHIHGKIGGRLHGDLDSNGWPQAGRNRALVSLRKAFAFHYAGDQHLGTIFHHGVDEFRDSIYSFCVPSIANFYLRWWRPLKSGANRLPGSPEYTGDLLDGFDNKVTCFAAANPEDYPAKGNELTTRAAGFGIVRFYKDTRKITMECWPRNVKIGEAGAKQYPGWPLTIDQEDNYGRKSKGYLPTLVISKTNQVVQVVNDSTHEVEYTLRIKGKKFSPKVFDLKAVYTIHVGEEKNKKSFTAVKASAGSSSKTITVNIK